MKTVNLIFPHQLFKESPLLNHEGAYYLIEEHLFFKQYRFHKQKIAFHRATMKSYERYLKGLGLNITYIESKSHLSDIRNFKKEIKKQQIEKINYIDPTDNWLSKRINKLALDCQLNKLENPLFLNTTEDLKHFFKKDKQSFFQTTFYKQQRKKHHILIDKNGEPEGGQWTYDSENRKKYPRKKTPPAIHFPESNKLWNESVKYTDKNFSENPGTLNTSRYYPIDFEESESWFNQFLNHRFFDFGIYEDAILKEQSFLNHSLLSPLMNVGLIDPKKVIKKSIAFAKKENIPVNSTEGFIRQIIGWREFIRGIYETKGSYSRNKNFWEFDRKIPKSFYDGTTGVLPIDQTIKKILETGYCHHIERLMVLGNFMLLCEFDPNEVYQWFMELFIDSYDWVMVPNVYGMCLFADGGTFATKPYIGGSNYIKKMSNYEKGDWEKIWDGLFWSFVMKHQEFFSKNPRTKMLLFSLNKMNENQKQAHLDTSNKFLSNLD